MLDKKIQSAKDYFGITSPSDWADVEPSWIIAIDGIGPVTLDHIRIYLAARDITLKNDRTAAYWRANLSAAKIGHTMGSKDVDLENPDSSDVGLICPFTVLIDSAEQQPFSFTGFKADAEFGSRPLIVPTEWRCLGRFPTSNGDYSIDGYVGRIGIERKSISDLYGTILGFRDRRKRFEKELENLSAMHKGFVVVEGNLDDVLREAPQWGKRTPAENRKSLFRSILAYKMRYSVQWEFAADRRGAEVWTFRALEKYWQMEMKKKVVEWKREKKERMENEVEKISIAPAMANTEHQAVVVAPSAVSLF